MDFVAEVLEYQVKPRELAVWALGGAGFVLRSLDGVLMIDAFLSDMPEGIPLTRKYSVPLPPSNIQALNLLLVTHEHSDHCDRNTIEVVMKTTDATLVGPSTCTALARQWGVQDDKIHTVGPGDEVFAGDMGVFALGYFDPSCAVGNTYLVRTQSITALHCGDSFGHERLEECGQRFDLDIVFVSTAANPPGKTWYMGPEEACRFAKALNPKVFVPMHWNIANETCLDPREIQMAARKFGILDRTRILNVGDQLIVSKSGPEERKST